VKSRTFIGHTKGILVSEGDKLKPREMLAGEDIVALAHDPHTPERMLAGSYGRGLFRSSDAGANWAHVDFDVEYVRAITFSECESATVYLGIEPAELFRSRDSGETWECLHIRRLPGAADWSLPYSPRGGALRTIALHPTDPRIIYGGVEQGGVVKSTDGGESWTIDKKHVDKDVHWISIHQTQPHVLLAATGDGLFLTRDGAASWTKLIDEYTRAAIIHPLDGTLAFAGPAHEVGEHGRIVRSRDGGENWELASEGVKLPMDDMVESFVIDPHDAATIFAIGSEGALLRSDIHTVAWQVVPNEVHVQCLDFVPLRPEPQQANRETN
jgi:photosystem II stability/assembly factor-like uncharacterized protein